MQSEIDFNDLLILLRMVLKILMKALKLSKAIFTGLGN